MPNIKSAKKRVRVTETKTLQKIDVAAAKGIIHKNCAAHQKSEFTKALNAMQA